MRMKYIQRLLAGIMLATGGAFPADGALVAGWGFGEGSGAVYDGVSGVGSTSAASFLGHGIVSILNDER